MSELIIQGLGFWEILLRFSWNADWPLFCLDSGWLNTGVSLDAVFTLQNVSCNKICFAFCISPHLLGGYEGNRSSYVRWALRAQQTEQWLCLAPFVICAPNLAGNNGSKWLVGCKIRDNNQEEVKLLVKWCWWLLLLACLCLQLLQPVPGGPSPILSKQAAISVMCMLMP